MITVKDRALTPNISAIEGLSHVLAQLNVPTIVVHGGGSFGHYWSVKYDIHTKPELYDSHGITVVHESMVALNQIVIKSMLDAGLAPYGISPTSLFTNGKANVTKFNELVEFTRRDIVPVIFGDVVHVNEGRFSILSGDALMTQIATYLRPSKVIFTVNVDGIYEDLRRRKLVKVFNLPNNEINIKNSSIDVTGGMGRKISEALEIARLGIDVNIVNGLSAERIFDILKGVKVKGTVIPASPHKRRK